MLCLQPFQGPPPGQGPPRGPPPGSMPPDPRGPPPRPDWNRPPGPGKWRSVRLYLKKEVRTSFYPSSADPKLCFSTLLTFVETDLYTQCIFKGVTSWLKALHESLLCAQLHNKVLDWVTSI